MSKPDIAGIAPFFIVKNVPAALSLYRDQLGFEVTFQGPDPGDIFFGRVQRGAALAAEFSSRKVEFSTPRRRR